MEDRNAVQNQRPKIETSHGLSQIIEECVKWLPEHYPKYDLCSDLRPTDVVQRLLEMLDWDSRNSVSRTATVCQILESCIEILGDPREPCTKLSIKFFLGNNPESPSSWTFRSAPTDESQGKEFCNAKATFFAKCAKHARMGIKDFSTGNRVSKSEIDIV